MLTSTRAGRTAVGILAAGLVVSAAPPASAGPDVDGYDRGRSVSDGAVDSAREAFEQDRAQDGGAAGHLAPVDRNVELLGKVEIAGVVPGQIADVAAFGNTAYLASFRTDACDSGGVYTVDITDVSAPKELGFIPTSSGSYVGEGMQVIEVGTAAAPRQLLLFNNETNLDCDVQNVPTGGITIVDVTNPAAPVVLAEHVGDRDPGDGTDQGYTNDVHSVFGWVDGGKTYAALADNEEETDLDIMDITDPSAPVLIAEYDLDKEFGVAQEELGDGSSFLHDAVVKEIGGVQTMLAPYWDGGYVQLDVDDPTAVTLINQTDFAATDPERAKRGEQVLPEGNAHYGEYTRDDRFFVATDEDFSPYKLKAEMADGTAFEVAPASDSRQIEPGTTLSGPTVFVGQACTTTSGDVVPPPSSPDQIAVAERGACSFEEKAASVGAVGYETVIVMNSQTPPGGSDPDAVLNPTAPNPDVALLFVGRADGLRILESYDESRPSSEQAAPAVGTEGQQVTFTSFFDGWGYVHLYDRQTATDVGTYAVPEAQDPAFAEGFGDLSVHEVATDPDQDISYLSYYSAGLRIVSQGGRGLQEVGAFIDEGGNNIWGVEVHQSPTAGKVVLASDRDYGLYIFRYQRAVAAKRAIDNSCPDGSVPRSQFSDVPADDVHALAIRCVAWYDIAEGFTDGTFRLENPVTRGQMASFIGRTILRGGGTLPDNAPDRFADDNGSVHERFINRLAAAGVVLGLPDGRYGANETVSRGQMATFLARAYKQVTGVELPAQGDYFDDDKESVHEVNINRVAQAGIAEGVGGTRFAPLADTKRGQMSTFLARLLDKLVEEGETSTP